MMQRGDKLRLPLEARDEVGINLQVGMQQLDSNKTLQLRVEGLPDLGHAAMSQALLQFVFSKTSWTRAHYLLLGRPPLSLPDSSRERLIEHVVAHPYRYVRARNPAWTGNAPPCHLPLLNGPGLQGAGAGSAIHGARCDIKGCQALDIVMNLH